MFKRVKRNLKYFIPLLMKLNPLAVVLMVFSAILATTGSLIWIVFPKLIIDELMGGKRIEKLIIIVVIFIVIKSLIDVFNQYANAKNELNANKVDFEIQRMFNKKISEVDYFKVEDPEFIDHMSRAKKAMNEHTGGIYSFIQRMRSLIYGVTSLLGVIGIVLYSGEYIVILVSLVGVSINIFTTIKYQKIDREFNISFSRHNRRMWYFNRTITSFRNQKELRTYASKKLLIDSAKKENDIGKKAYSKNTNKLQFLAFIDVFGASFINQFLVLFLLVYSLYQGNMTIATLTMLFGAINVLDNAMSNIVYSTRSYYEDCIYQEEFINFMETESVFKQGTLPIQNLHTIEFRNVSFKYPRTDTYILKNVSFTINDKEKISIVGLNGSGKTTIIKLLCRFFSVSEGEILINGIHIENYDNAQYMKLMAVVFQDFSIISYTVRANIAITENDQNKLYNVLERAQVLDTILRLPNKEHTYVNKWFNKRGVEFSGGEMQKFAIARSIYKDAQLVILDEPTSSLDPISEAEIYYKYNDVIGKKTSIFISHRLASCIFSDRILVLDGAHIVEEGTHKDLISNKEGLYHKMFTAQAEYYK